MHNLSKDLLPKIDVHLDAILIMKPDYLDPKILESVAFSAETSAPSSTNSESAVRDFLNF